MMNKLNVVFLSDWIVNPYKELLSKHLSLQGATVSEHLWSTFFLTKVLNHGRVDILHLHTLHPFLLGRSRAARTLKLLFFIAQVIVLRILGTKTVWTVHEWSDKLYGGTNNLSVKLAAIAASSFSTVIVHCQSTKQEISELLNLAAQKVVVIPHGNYIQYYENNIGTARARETLKLPGDRLVFLLFGNIYRYKGVIEAIEAFKMLNCDRASLVIAGKVGETGLEAEIASAITGNSNIILVAERIEDNDVQTYMNAADCILLPYTIYTTSGIAILAMSFAKACIAPDNGFFSDVIDTQGGFLYSLPHQQGLATAMNQALDKRGKLEKMGAYNLARVTEWDWDYVTKLTIAAYRGDRLGVLNE